MWICCSLLHLSAAVMRMQAKELLEGGYTLHSPLLATLITKFSAFVNGAGLRSYNFFLLPIFTFIRKCCGVPQAELDGYLRKGGILGLVYAPPGAPPRPITPLTANAQPSVCLLYTSPSPRD